MSKVISSVKVGTELSSVVRLNDGVDMPLFGLGTYLSEPGKSTEEAVLYAIEHGYNMIDTAQFYGYNNIYIPYIIQSIYYRY